jgi:hypothetical protein
MQLTSYRSIPTVVNKYVLTLIEQHTNINIVKADPANLAVAILNQEEQFAIIRSRSGATVDPLAQLLLQKGINRAGNIKPMLSKKAEDNFRREFGVSSSSLGFIGVARERVGSHVREFSTYERAAKAYRAELKLHIDTWIAAGGDHERWTHGNPELAEAFEEKLRKMTVSIQPGGQKPTLVASEPWRVRDTPVKKSRLEAVVLFVELITLPLEEGGKARLGQCAYCHRYYVNQRGRKDSRFCPAPRECGRKFSATQAVLKKAKRERDRKLALVKKAIPTWSAAKGPWSDYLARKTGLKKTFITRVLNDELKHLRPRKRRM